MRFNEKEMATLASGASDKEGRLNHRNLSFREVFKERWFKLKGNLLFYFRLNEHGAFLDDADRKHLFTCTTQKHCDEWVSCLQQASYEYQRGRLLYMQQKILELTGRDPLADFISRRNGNAPGSVQAIQKAPETNSSTADVKKRTTIWH